MTDAAVTRAPRFGPDARLAIGILALQFFAAIPANTAPLMNGALIDGFDLSTSIVGAIASVKTLCFSAVLVFLAGLPRRVPLRTLALTGLTIACVMDLSSALVANAIPLTVLRGLSGMGVGLATLAGVAALASTGRVDRLAAMVGVLVFILIVPTVMIAAEMVERGGVRWLFAFLAALALLTCLPAATLPMVRGDGKDVHPIDLRRSFASPLVWASVTGFFGAAAVWAFSERLGLSLGLSVKEVGNLLAITGLAGLFGGMAALLLTRPGREWRLALVGFVAFGAFGIALALSGSVTMYAVTLAGFTFCYVFIAPFILALACRVDASGALAANMIGISTLAAAFAPALAGVIISGGELGRVAWVPAIGTVVAVAALLRLRATAST